MKLVKLSDIFDLQMGKTPARAKMEYWSNGIYPWIAISDLTENKKFIYNTKESISQIAINKSGIKVVPKNTVIMSFKLSIGKTAITTQNMYTNEAIMSFIPRNGIEIFPDYFYYLLPTIKWNNTSNRAVMGTTLNKHVIENTRITFPDLQVQKNIAFILDKAQEIIQQRKKQLELLDGLTKSRFRELFGDAITNSKKWDKEELEGVCKEILGGGTPSKSHVEYFVGEIPWITPKDMKSRIIEDSIEHISEEAIKHSSAKLIPQNSVLMVIRSGILKHTLPLAINSIPVTINQDMKAFVPNDRVNAAYLMYYFKDIEIDVLRGVRSVTADNIDFKMFKRRKILIPPIELQNQFAAFVKETDKSRKIALIFDRYSKFLDTIHI